MKLSESTRIPEIILTICHFFHSSHSAICRLNQSGIHSHLPSETQEVHLLDPKQDKNNL